MVLDWRDRTAASTRSLTRMARIRTVKPGFFLNEDVAALPFAWRLLFIGLWTQADRAGRLEDRPARLKAVLFPYDDLDVNDGLGCLANAGLITRYDRNGCSYIAIPTWEKHQQPHVREAESDLPAPPCLDDQKPGASLVRAAQEGKGTDQGREGKGTGTDPHALRARFERFWSSYPRKVAKDAAWLVWQKRKPDDALTAQMIAAVLEQTHSPQWQKDGGQFIPHPRTWLNQGRWQDGPEPDVRGDDGLNGLRAAVRSHA